VKWTYITKKGLDGEPVIPDIAKQYVKDIKVTPTYIEVNLEIPDSEWNDNLMKKLLEAPSDIFDINPPIPAPQPTTQQSTDSDNSTSSTQ
jgi:hypothetical protein